MDINREIRKKIVAGMLFALLAVYTAFHVPSVEVAWVSGFLILTIYLFAFEIVSVDVAAITVMVLLGLTTLLAPLMGLEKGLVDNKHLFDGFSSNAVMSIIAVMIIGAGLDKTGLMSKVAAFILNIGGASEKRIIPIISSTVAIISSFMQNVGAAALFLPVASRIAARSGIPLSRLLMPMGFCAILGGTITLVGSSPLILLNDLILNSNAALPADQHMHTWSLFSVTPVGLALVATGVLYFVLAGRYVLPVTEGKQANVMGEGTLNYLSRIYGLKYDINEVVLEEDSPLVGRGVLEIEEEFKVRIVAILAGDELLIGANKIDRDVTISRGAVLGIVGTPYAIQEFCDKNKARRRQQLHALAEVLSPARSGIAELVIPPSSSLIGKSAKDVWFRQRYGAAIIGLYRQGKVYEEGEGIRDMPFQGGDTLIVHVTWQALQVLEQDRDFVVITTEYPHEELRAEKVGWAGLFFAIALGLVLFTDLRLSVALLAGAMGMVISGVLKIDEAYEAVSWKTVFLLASLIPLGLAVETSGTAKWIADQTLGLLGDVPIWELQLTVAALSTFFTLVMSNVGATVLLVPLAVNMAIGAGADPAVFALTVAIATSNSFIIPTHQVNALIMGPGGYRVPDFMRAGGVMTILFLVVMMVMMNLIY